MFAAVTWDFVFAEEKINGTNKCGETNTQANSSNKGGFKRKNFSERIRHSHYSNRHTDPDTRKLWSLKSFTWPSKRYPCLIPNALGGKQSYWLLKHCASGHVKNTSLKRIWLLEIATRLAQTKYDSKRKHSVVGINMAHRVHIVFRTLERSTAVIAKWQCPRRKWVQRIHLLFYAKQARRSVCSLLLYYLLVHAV